MNDANDTNLVRADFIQDQIPAMSALPQATNVVARHDRVRFRSVGQAETFAFDFDDERFGPLRIVLRDVVANVLQIAPRIGG